MLRDPSRVKITIRIPEAMYRALEEYASKNGISIALAIKLIIKRYFGM